MVVVRTERLILRGFEDGDWPATHAYESDPETVRYQSSGVHTPQ